MSIPEIKLKGISQEGFADAFAVLDECRIDCVPVMGCDYPFFAPGGLYGPNWWNIDSSVALVGYRYKDRALAENALRNFFKIQKADGRIPLWGNDHVPKYDEEISSLPKIMEVAYKLASESADESFVKDCLRMIDGYLNWWMEKRLDEETGLVSSVFEETFVPYLHKSGERAAVDTNVEVVVGFGCAAALARRLGDIDAAERYEKKKADFAAAINRWLWNEQKGAYYPLMLETKEREDFLMASAFLPLRAKIATKERAGKLVKLLTGPRFGWGTYPVFSAAKDDPQFTVTEGDYQFNASWSGSVWTLLNEAIVKGLKESGYADLAASLAYRTVKEFHENYTEFLQPFNGSGHGVKRYAWTAAQYIELVLEVIFGISADAQSKTVRIEPLLADELKRGTLSVKKFPLPDGGTLAVQIENGRVRWAQTENTDYLIAETAK